MDTGAARAIYCRTTFRATALQLEHLFGGTLLSGQLQLASLQQSLKLFICHLVSLLSVY
jgi:hypothetical protein